MGRIVRRPEIDKKRKRKSSLAKLKARLAVAKDGKTKERLLRRFDAVASAEHARAYRRQIGAPAVVPAASPPAPKHGFAPPYKKAA